MYVCTYIMKRFDHLYINSNREVNATGYLRPEEDNTFFKHFIPILGSSKTMMNDYQKKLLSTEEHEYALVLKEFNATEKMLNDNLDRLRIWLKTQPHLCEIKIEDSVLKRYLLCNGFNVEKAKMKIDNMYTARSTLSEFFTKRDITLSDMSESMNIGGWCILPDKTPDNGRIIFMCIFSDNPEEFDPMSWIKVGFMIGDLRMKLETTVTDQYIFDCKNMTMAHATKWIPYMKRQAFILQKCYSARIKGIHILNCPPFLSNVMIFFKSTLKKKIADRLHIHKNLEEFHKHIPVELLPCDLGGKQLSRQQIIDDWKKAMSSPEIRNWFINEEKQKSNEAKRINTSEVNEFSGTQGTFRTLCID